MHMSLQYKQLSTLGLCLCVAVIGCADDTISETGLDSSTGTGTETGDGDGDMSGDGDGDMSGDGDGDPATGDGDGDMSGDGDGDMSGDGDGDMTGDGDGDMTGDGDGDGDMMAVCGDGVVEGMEACDDGNDDNTDDCLDTCAAASCGDGFVWVDNEACDDGNDVDTDACTTTCAAAACGDGVVWEGMEACDDGNEVDTDDCPTTCAVASCGDGFLWAGNETCEDGNADPGDGCDDSCTTELYYKCDDMGCEPVRIMVAIADVDDPDSRMAIAALTGGPVDYFDPRAATPTLDELEADYDCVMTHPNFEYLDSAALGEVLAAYVDGGGVVVLGVASGYDPPVGLATTPIMAPEYSPVTNAGQVLFQAADYQDDGIGLLYTNVTALGIEIYDDGVMTQGEGVADGTLGGDVVLAAYRPDYHVVYINGTAHASFNGTGDWDILVANACSAAWTMPAMP